MPELLLPHFLLPMVSLFLWTFASGFAAKRNRSLRVKGVDVRPLISVLLTFAPLLGDDLRLVPPFWALANGTLGSFLAEWGFDRGVAAATPRQGEHRRRLRAQAEEMGHVWGLQTGGVCDRCLKDLTIPGVAEVRCEPLVDVPEEEVHDA